jgi:hypothetical protein
MWIRRSSPKRLSTRPRPRWRRRLQPVALPLYADAQSTPRFISFNRKSHERTASAMIVSVGF